MPLAESILAIFGTTVGTASGYKDLRDFLHSHVEIEKVLTKLVEDGFHLRLPRLSHLCLGGEPSFDRERFYHLVTSSTLEVNRLDKLKTALLPLLAESILTPDAIYIERDIFPVYESIIDSALRGMWRKIGTYDAVANAIILSQNEALLKGQERMSDGVDQSFSNIGDAIVNVDSEIEELRRSIKELAAFAQSIPQQVFDKLTDSSPPAEHRIGEQVYLNPFLLVKAEDFNHNYDKLARLFQASPEWHAIQSRTENVFIEGGRGTGKSMLLRRLTAQATIAAKRIIESSATFDDVDVDYFGVYVKLTRGYYEQFKSINTISPVASSLHDQHELNIEIFDAFIDTIQWLVNNRALPSVTSQLDRPIKELATLFSWNSTIHTLDDIKLGLSGMNKNKLSNSIERKHSVSMFLTKAQPATQWGSCANSRKFSVPIFFRRNRCAYFF